MVCFPANIWEIELHRNSKWLWLVEDLPDSETETDVIINTKSVCLSITGGFSLDLGDAVDPGKPLERSLCHDIASVRTV